MEPWSACSLQPQLRGRPGAEEEWSGGDGCVTKEWRRIEFKLQYLARFLSDKELEKWMEKGKRNVRGRRSLRKRKNERERRGRRRCFHF